MAKKEERFEVVFVDGSQLKDAGVRTLLPGIRMGRVLRDFRKLLPSSVISIFLFQHLIVQY